MENQQQQASNGIKRAPITEADVQRMLRMKDFYEILDVSKTATDEELKKQYKKLALRYHPDKLKLKGAQEVFKKIAKAYDCLTDPDKRAFYDRTGSDEPQQQARYEQRYYQAGEFDPNDIFNSFFGNGFYQNQHPRFRRQEHHQNEARGNEQNGNFLQLLSMLPFLLIILSGLFGSFSMDSPEFSLSSTNSFSVHRKSTLLDVSYYVDNSFQDKVMENEEYLQQFEWKVENEYIQTIEYTCANQQNLKRIYQNQAKMAYSREAQNKYQSYSDSVDISSCYQFENIQNQYDIKKYF